MALVAKRNRTFREEFYPKRDVMDGLSKAINAALQKAILKYNAYRFHANLNLLAPLAYN
jgi:hypothetical protein